MNQIDTVEVRYFRSIYRVRLSNLTDVVIFAGKNDVGKSNILKALNLFFNNETDWKTPLDFGQDFCRRRLTEVRKETIRGKQFIQIKVRFLRGRRYEKSLPKRFTVTRTWDRNSLTPSTKNDLATLFGRGDVPTKNLDRALAALQRYLNTVRFEYVPAIKDAGFFAYMLGRLQDLILEKRSGESDIADSVKMLNETVKREATELRDEFERVSGISTSVSLPDQLDELFRAFSVVTRSGDEDLPLSLRGDGIRSRFLPSLLHHISRHSKLFYIWGFEEPENSLEHKLATELASDIVDVYSQQAQVFITSHSPAFFGVEDDRASVHRVFWGDDGTGVQELGSPISEILEEELGLMKFQQEYQREFKAKVATLNSQLTALEEIRKRMQRKTSPVLLTEGKWDAKILSTAWKKLFGDTQRRFRILPCDPSPGDTESSGGGFGILKKCLETVRHDEPINIGLFDRDHDGAKAFDTLTPTFHRLEAQPDVKTQNRGTAGAILLPIIPGREKYAEIGNLCLEFYFDDEYLESKVNEKGLKLRQRPIQQTLFGTGKKLGQVPSTEPHMREVLDSSKKAFAEQVVPRLPQDAFQHFEPLFDLVEIAIDHVKQTRTAAR